MTQTTDLARQSSQSIEQARPRRDLTLEMITEMTGYSLPQIALIRSTVAKDAATLTDLALFLTASKTLDLDPLLRQVHWIMRAGKGTLQVGIDGYRAVAERTGVYAGSEPPVFRGSLEQDFTEKQWDKGHESNVARKMIVPEKASVTVWKIVAGHKAAFTGEAWWTEFYPGQKEGFMYRKMPRHMLSKDAEAQALRKAFPAQLGAVAYASTLEVSEMDLPEVAAPERVIEQPHVAPPPRPKPTAEDYDRIIGSQYPDDLPAEPAHPEPAPDTREARLETLQEMAKRRGIKGKPPAPQAGEDALDAAISFWDWRIAEHDRDQQAAKESQEGF